MRLALGEVYVADPRFRATYEEIAPGLATWVRDAIVANGGTRSDRVTLGGGSRQR